MDLFEAPKERNIDDVIQSVAISTLSLIPIAGPALSNLIAELMPSTFKSRITACLESFASYLNEIERERQLNTALNPFTGYLLKKCSELAAFSVIEEQPNNLGRAAASLSVESNLVFENSLYLLKIVSQLDNTDLVLLMYYGCKSQQEKTLKESYPEILDKENLGSDTTYTRERRLISYGLLVEEQETSPRPSLFQHTIHLGEGEYELDEIGRIIQHLPEHLPVYTRLGTPIMIKYTSKMGMDVINLINPPCLQLIKGNQNE